MINIKLLCNSILGDECELILRKYIGEDFKTVRIQDWPHRINRSLNDHHLIKMSDEIHIGIRAIKKHHENRYHELESNLRKYQELLTEYRKWESINA